MCWHSMNSGYSFLAVSRTYIWALLFSWRKPNAPVSAAWVLKPQDIAATCEAHKFLQAALEKNVICN